eukprot:6204397-Pleurochrysis_carterae.AAC.1
MAILASSLVSGRFAFYCMAPLQVRLAVEANLRLRATLPDALSRERCHIRRRMHVYALFVLQIGTYHVPPHSCSARPTSCTLPVAPAGPQEESTGTPWYGACSRTGYRIPFWICIPSCRACAPSSEGNVLTRTQMLYFASSVGLLSTSLVAVLAVASPALRAASFFLFVTFCNGVPFIYQGADRPSLARAHPPTCAWGSEHACCSVVTASKGTSRPRKVAFFGRLQYGTSGLASFQYGTF